MKSVSLNSAKISHAIDMFITRKYEIFIEKTARECALKKKKMLIIIIIKFN